MDVGAFCVELWSFYCSKRISVPMSYISFWEHCLLLRDWHINWPKHCLLLRDWHIHWPKHCLLLRDWYVLDQTYGFLANQCTKGGPGDTRKFVDPPGGDLQEGSPRLPPPDFRKMWATIVVTTRGTSGRRNYLISYVDLSMRTSEENSHTLDRSERVGGLLRSNRRTWRRRNERNNLQK